MIKFLKYILIVFLIVNKGFSQYELNLTDYYASPINYNPGYVGVTEGYYMKGYYSTQWIGFDGAPNTQLFEGHYKFNNKNFAAGISILNDTFGNSRSFNFETNFSVDLGITSNISMALGLKIGSNSFSLNNSQLNVFDRTEYVFSKEIDSYFKPIVGSGLFVYSDNFFVSFSLPNFLKNSLYGEDKQIIYNYKSPFFSSLGYNFNLNSTIKMYNQILMRFQKQFPNSYLITSKILYNNRFGLSFMYEPKTLYGFLFFIPINQNIRLSYGFNFPQNKILNNSNLNYSFGLSFQALKNVMSWSDKEESDKPFIIR